MFLHSASPAVQSIVTYRFGSTPDATRPDRVMRPPTTALLILQQGTLFEHAGSEYKTPLPNISLLGPSDQGRTWSTAPDTLFTLVNLAPGASRRLFGVDPRDIAGFTDSLQGHTLAEDLREQLARGRRALHTYLCGIVRDRATPSPEESRGMRVLLNALQKRRLGDSVKDYADHFGITSRTLQRTVRAASGLTPKQILGVERIRDLVVLTSGGWKRTLADLAQSAGYFDQSHMRQELLRHNFGRVGELVGGDHIINEA